MTELIRRLWVWVSCRHTKVRVTRWHRDTVSKAMFDKALYIDEHFVVCLVQCCRCGEILNTDQKDMLYRDRRVK